MRLEFYYDKNKSDQKKINDILSSLNRAKKLGYKVVINEISGIADDKRFELYQKAWTPSIFKKYKIRKVFGTHRNPGCQFGEVPALLVYENDNNYSSDVFPHDKHGKLETIEEFLNTIN